MNEDRFDELMHDAQRTYRNPPQPDFEAMWKGIEREHFGAPERSPRFRLSTNRWVGIAATLIVGIGMGRASIMLSHNASPARGGSSVAMRTSEIHADSAMARPYELETSQYLGQTAALLVALPSELKAGTSAQFTSRAGDLLSRTRLLMDSPAADDPAMRALLEDLELVLMQVVRLQSGNRSDLDLINRALEQRDVIPRLRTAAADISAN
jgi:hypothetical protein